MNTHWQMMPIANGTMLNLLRGTHRMWSRLFDGEQVFTVRPIGETPADEDGGYPSIAAAFTIKGML